MKFEMSGHFRDMINQRNIRFKGKLKGYTIMPAGIEELEKFGKLITKREDTMMAVKGNTKIIYSQERDKRVGITAFNFNLKSYE